MDISAENIVKVKTFGNVDRGFRKKLLDIIVDCYEKLGPPVTYSVSLNIFETSEGPGFFASHNALQGKEREEEALIGFKSVLATVTLIIRLGKNSQKPCREEG